MSNFNYLPYVSYEIGVDTENPVPDYCPNTEIVSYDNTNQVYVGGIRPVAPLERIMVTAIFDRAAYVAAMNAAGYGGSPQPIPVGIQLCWSDGMPTGCHNALNGVVWYSPDTNEVYVRGLFRVPLAWAGQQKHVSLAISFLHGNQTDTFIIPFQISVGLDNKDFYTGDDVFTDVVWKKDNQIITEICERSGIIELWATHDRDGWVPFAILHTGGAFGSEFDPYDSDNLDPAFPPNQGQLQQLPVLSVQSQDTQTEIIKIDTSKIKGGECVIVVIKDGTSGDPSCGLSERDVTLQVTWAQVGGGYRAYVDWEIDPPLPSGIALAWNVFAVPMYNNLPSIQFLGGPELNTGSFETDTVLTNLPFAWQITLNITAAGEDGTCAWYYETPWLRTFLEPQEFEDVEMILI